MPLFGDNIVFVTNNYEYIWNRVLLNGHKNNGLIFENDKLCILVHIGWFFVTMDLKSTFSCI